jgi:peptidoglycan/xylan/chitin deacetylase (PgdA/CDA1 family)
VSGFVKRCIKSLLVLAGGMAPPARAGCAFLIYHRVNGHLPIELDLSPELVERQFEYLARSQQVIGYEMALTRLREGSEFSNREFVLTFDDGYLDFYTNVYPLLKRWQLPAILFVTTGFVEDRVPYPMLSNPNLAVEPVSWEMLGEMAESGLVTLGAHTHTHPVLTEVSGEQVEEELTKPLALFRQRLGMTPLHFCYPRAIWSPDVESHVMRHYQSAVVGGGQWALPTDFNPYRIPRLPIRRSDGWDYFQAKVEGRMANEEELYARLHRVLGR